jgi:hypothetical protein
MPLYQFDNSSLIDEVTLIKNASGGQRAYLHAREDATAEQLAEVMKQLSEHHYLSVPYKKDGKPVLEVRGFGKEEKLMTTLKSRKLVGGKQGKKEVPEDRVSWLEKFKANSLWLVAFIYLSGDLGYMAYEHMEAKDEKDKKKHKSTTDLVMDRIGGLGYFAGSLTLLGSLMAGKDTAEDEIQKAAKLATEKAAELGMELDEEGALVSFAHQKDDRSKFIKTFSKYPSEIMNACFSAAGVGIAYTARRKFAEAKDLEKKQKDGVVLSEDDQELLDKKSVYSKDRYLGIISGVAGAYGAVMPEKAPDPTKPRKKGVEGAIEWISQRPLSVAGFGLLISSAIHVVSSFEERNKLQGRKEKMLKEAGGQAKYDKKMFGNKMRFIFVIASIVAEVILFFSSKGHGKGVKTDESVDPSTCSMVAEMIAKQPKETHADLTDKMSEFLSMPDVLGTNQETLKTMINGKLEELDKNPWMAATKKKAPIASLGNSAQERAAKAAEISTSPFLS